MSQPPLTNSVTKEYANNLNNYGVIQLTGEEKSSYLQGQITADLNQLKDDKALLGCHCDFKGKTWSVFYTFIWKESILLVIHNSVLEKSLSELKKYGVFAKVEITDQSSTWQLTGGSGTEFEDTLKPIFGELPTLNRSVVSNDYGLVMAINQPEQRYLVLQPDNTEKRLSAEFTQDNELWEIADIQAGIGEIRDSSVNEYVPQMLNLQALDAIDFNKGCYMGQEVVARTKYLGRNKRAGFILKTESKNGNLSGEQLEYQIGENWRPGGKILRSGSNSEQTWAFAVLANDTEVGSNFRVKSSPDIILVVQALPYPLQ
ncbi:tRNA-modifying protein YgfZ [Paraglaciecola arctica]|uniref:tRNA-modifying protein YgfZ n=1 Tax=Paraglaciecola arctica TaxID=1128911 RepID=UPI001C0726D6|nr:tRNA-modifying protein YgfZ [Paraglaciecola arctica]MBU3003702.1 tRNA-modifying protein YgfZ [Paraglaciecola arctica]